MSILRHAYVRSISSLINYSQSKLVHTSSVNLFKLTDYLKSEPLKAKKRVDPAVLQAREARRRKRIEREIKRIEKFGKKLKPIEEREPDRLIAKEAEIRKRPVNESSKGDTTVNGQLDEEHFLKKEWARYLTQQHMHQMSQLNRALKSQKIALDELKKDNITLYNMAIQLDSNLIPYVREGPVHTPPLKSQEYEPPEGDYLDVTYLYDKRV